MGRDHYLVCYDARFGRRFEAYLLHASLERVVGVGIDGEFHALSVVYLSDVGLIDVGYNLHLRQVVGYGEERRSLETRGDGLSLLYRAADDHSVDGRCDGCITQVALHLDDGCLGLLIGVARLFVEVECLVVFGIADQLLFVQRACAGIVLRLVFVFVPAACEFCFRLFELGLKCDLVHFGDQLPGLHLVIVVDIKAVYDSRNLGSDLHLRNGFHCAGRHDRVADRDAACRGRLQRDPLFTGIA